MLEQRHYDLIGLGLFAAGVFLAFPLYLGWDAGAGGSRSSTACCGSSAASPTSSRSASLAAGAVLVMRPVLPAVRPLPRGGRSACSAR